MKLRCEDVLESLSAFHDDELDPVRSREYQEHLESCPSCTAALGRMQELSEELHREAPYYRAPDTLRARVSQAAWSNARGDRVPGRRVGLTAPAWLGAAAVVILAVGSPWVVTSLHRQAGVGALEREVVSSHVRSLMASHLTDVASTDQHTVKPWFDGKLDFSPPVTDLSTSGYPLIGGRLDYLGGRPVAALVYQHRKHFINAFVWPDERAADSESPPRAQQGYHVIRATRGGMTFWIVSDLNPEELSTFARLLETDGKTTP